MSLRLLQLHCARPPEGKLAELIEQQALLARSACEGDRLMIQLLLAAEQAEALTDQLREGIEAGVIERVCLLPVVATLPEPDSDEGEAGDGDGDAEQADAVPAPLPSGRVSREELRNDIEESLGLTRVYLFTSLLSCFVAAIGLLRDDDVVLIGAMVIAPLLGPLVAISLGAVLGDLVLIRRALLTGAVGAGASLLLAIALGLWLTVDPQAEALSRRSQVEAYDVLLALAAGAAGVFAFTRGVAAALIGVMVAVALMPPLVVAGLQLGAWHPSAAAGALGLFGTNVLCVVLAGVGSFALQGVRPHTWWAAEQARRASWTAALSCLLLLGLLLAALRWL